MPVHAQVASDSWLSSPGTRAESLVELLEMKILMGRTPGRSGVAH
jgi:hypothetical protein